MRPSQFMQGLNIRPKHFLFFGLAALLITALGFAGNALLHHYYKRGLESIPKVSEALSKNPMLAATRLLEAHHYRVEQVPELKDTVITNLVDGTLFLENSDGYMSADQAKKIFAWIAKGNTLIILPRIKKDDASETTDTSNAPPEDVKKNQPEDNSSEQEASKDFPISPEDEQETQTESGQAKTPAPSMPAAKTDGPAAPPGVVREPISDYLGLRVVFQTPKALASVFARDKNKERKVATWVDVPELPYLLEIERPAWKLHAKENAPEFLFSDDDGEVVRVYEYEEGHIVALADNIFEAYRLRNFDHAQLLLQLAALNPNAKHVSLVERLRFDPWYELLWKNFSVALLCIGLLLSLAFWRAVRRFGPLLPEINQQRRSLIEHVDASGRWAWQSELGRNLLLSAARRSLQKLLARRLPQLQRKLPDEQVQYLAEQTGLSEEEVDLAFMRQPASNPLVFTRQIQLLQQLRTHYER